MGRECKAHEEKTNAYRHFVRMPEGKRPVGRPRRKLENNITVDLREIGWDDMDCIRLA
jgi:hypothetical protein